MTNGIDGNINIRCGVPAAEDLVSAGHVCGNVSWREQIVIVVIINTLTNLCT